MPEEHKQEQRSESASAKDALVRFVYIFAKFSWFFGIIIAGIVLLALYRFVIQPQYQKIVAKQEEIRQLNLEGEKQTLKTHVENLKQFITLSEAITREEENNLDRLLPATPDALVLQIQFDKLMKKYEAQNTSVQLSSPLFADEDAEEPAEQTTGNTRERIVDLSSFFDEPGATPQITNETVEKKIVLGQIPITVEATFEDYFKAKDFIRDIEHLVPLVDIQDISVAVNNVEEVETTDEKTNADTGDVEQEEESTEDFSSKPGATTVSLTGNIQIARIQ